MKRKHVRTTAARGRKHLSSCTGYRTPDPTPSEIETRKAALRAAREKRLVTPELAPMDAEPEASSPASPAASSADRCW